MKSLNSHNLPPCQGRALLELIALLMILSVFLPVQAASATKATISANIINPIGITTQKSLKIAEVASRNLLGTITLKPRNIRTATSGFEINSASTSSAAEFTIEGGPNVIYNISLPDSVLLRDAQGNTLMVNRFTSLPKVSGLLEDSGQQQLSVDATLNVEESQSDGAYLGTMLITIQYN